MEALCHPLFINPPCRQWFGRSWGSVCGEPGIWFHVLGWVFSTLSHILALPWKFTLNGRFWGIACPVLGWFGSVGLRAVETRGCLGSWRSYQQCPALPVGRAVRLMQSFWFCGGDLAVPRACVPTAGALQHSRAVAGGCQPCCKSLQLLQCPSWERFCTKSYGKLCSLF